MKAVLVAPSNKFLFNPLMAEPLGLMQIEGVLNNAGIDTDMVDMSFDDPIPEGDVYFFSASTVHYPQMVEIAKKVRKEHNAFTIIGGPHASALPKEVNNDFDAVVVGPGEKEVLNVIHNLHRDYPAGIFYGKLQHEEDIPIPKRTILYKHKYSVFPGVTVSASLMTSRGCPYSCSFCASNAIWGRRVLYYSVDRVVREITYLKDTFGIKHFKFIDDIFTLDKKRFKIFSDVLSKLDIKWFCDTRIDAIDDDTLDRMIKSGCDCVDLGVESVDDNVLKGVNKQQRIKDVEKAIQKIKSKGMKVKIYLIYGLPFEPADIVQKTIDFIEKNKPDHVSLFTLTPYPGTDIWLNPDKYNIKKIYDDFSVYQHSVGGIEEELSWLSSVEYNDRSREQMRDERNRLKKYSMEWNTAHI